jgi:hypothetical protein
MPLNKLYKYEIPEEINKMGDEEEKVIALLRNIRSNAALLRPSLSKENLEFVLERVKEGRWILSSQNILNTPFLDKSIGKEIKLNYDLNLSEAQEVIDNYIAHSEKGCEYCGNLGKVYEKNETFRYCKIDETEKSIVDFPLLNNESPKIHQFYKIGCKDRTSTFRLLEELLKENKE